MSSAMLDLTLDAPVAQAASSVSELAVIPELWISFVSLMRSHLGALQTTGKLSKATLSEGAANSFTIHDLSRRLDMTIALETGHGTYRIDRMRQTLQQGSWQLAADATIQIGGHSFGDMEFGVEEFARRLWATQTEAVTL